ncbi:nucleobindin-2 isoform X4 [Bradysia coprophila]|uniref:nucleobindin-2 isoform X4 n=1 Tax=Bradysia coprophila TaxID=38358 RepID=UPI00187D6F28|nr:nucleobindin-2 isoform X4 [Bradysia coprophila]
MRRIILLFFVALSPILSLPVTKTTKKPVEETGDLEHNLEYERYLKEIVEALESDPEFRQKLNNASEDDIRSGNIAHELEYVNHQVRTRLDEIKREEMERLRQLINKQYQLNNQIDEEHLKVSSLAHVDHENMHTFEIKDLQKLITKLSEDLNAADKKRREEFKQYELEKEFEKQEKLRGYGDDSRAEHEAELKKLEQKHNEHPKVHHPGNKAQLEEVWEEQDHMEGMDFDPQTFFMMHDIDSNGVWDQNEVKALFVKELDKVYQQGLPEDDMRERAEEMERMREHVFTEADRNRDGVIDYQEFIDQTKKDEFQRDPGWDTVDTEKVYTHDEYLEFERRRQEEINRMMAEHPEKYPNYHQDPHHQQNYNQHLDQQHVNQQQQYQNQQQNQNQQFQQQNQIPQQQYQNQQQQQQQQPNQPSQEQPTQQKPLSQSSNSNQIDSNQANSKVQNSVEQKPIQHGQPQVIQQH